MKAIAEVSAYTLEDAETELRNTYWVIRASRTTNWRAVNKVRFVRMAMERMGVTKQEIKNAMHCLKTKDCKICKCTSDDGIPCWAISRRREAARREAASVAALADARAAARSAA